MTDNIERGRQMLLQNHRLSLRCALEELETNEESVSRAILQDLFKLKIYSRFVLHSLTDELEKNTMHTIGDITDKSGKLNLLHDNVPSHTGIRYATSCADAI
ncbi:hypothetical protein NPIL_399091 [Nephila pilipes]|uniref:Uncharacterized protein n=1 Tax=Nephila pilipes TaxID=299642 RepID=A0A8X6QZY4_NEPPI|nr:hypothetical protein NPIL_399091 [Nephila pilipes]